MRRLTARDELLGTLPGSWLLRQLAGHWAADLPAYALGGAVGLFHAFGPDPEPVVVGDADDAAALARRIRADHADLVERCSVPEAAAARLAAEDGLVPVVGWAFRWTDETPRLPVAGDPEWTTDDAEVRTVLDQGFPDASLPVGHPDVRRWAALRRDGRLVAVAADATTVPGLGFLASIATLPDVRGSGAGAAVTAWATAELLAEHGTCGLWHMAGNGVAAALYTRLGFRDDDRMAVVAPA